MKYNMTRSLINAIGCYLNKLQIIGRLFYMSYLTYIIIIISY